MTKSPAWSYSSLTAFETCPKRYQLTRVTKQVFEPQTTATTWGNTVHKALENRVKTGTGLPETMKAYESIAAKIVATPGKRVVEQRLAVNRSFQPTGWMAADVWCRGVVDVGVLGRAHGVLLDYKTGKRKVDSDQLRLFAALAFSHYTYLESVGTGFIWLKDNRIDRCAFSAAQVPDLWGTFLPRVQRLERAYDEGKWVARPSGLCREWCPVGRSLCEFCGKT